MGFFSSLADPNKWTSEGIVAAFTVVLAISTIGLWNSTRQLWNAGERQLAHMTTTAAQQLRAYIYVEKSNFTFHPSTGTWKVTYCIKNYGQTPAHFVKLVSVVQAVDWNNAHPQIPVPNENEALGSVAPSGDFVELEPKFVGAATDAEIREGVKAIYLVGKITYDTVFDIGQRTTNFRYYIGGDMGCEGNELYADFEGNDAT